MRNPIIRFTGRSLRWLANRLDPPAPDKWAFLDAKQRETGGIEPIDFGSVVRAYAMGRNPFFVQVGAHSGTLNDPLEQAVRELGLRGIMVEPQAREAAQLAAHYADAPGIIVERAAIAAEDGEVTLYSVDPDFWTAHDLPPDAMTQISSLDPRLIRSVIEKLGSAKLAANESAYLRSEQVPAMTLGSLLSKHGVRNLDILQLDTEGFDYEILKMVDWSLAPALINFEVLHLSDEHKRAAWAMLRSQGYTLYASSILDTLAIRTG